VIVIGMHRSGTSVVSAMLATLGVYMGKGLLPYNQGEGFGAAVEREPWPDHGEAPEFRRVNDLILAAAGARWNHIEPFLARRDDPGFRARALRRLQKATFGALRWQFLRPLSRDYRGAWGWKDPRTSVTLPYWLRLFPDARIIHVRRDEAAVVASLQRRAVQWHVPSGPRPPLAARLRNALRSPLAVLRALARRAGVPLPAAPPEPTLDAAYCRQLAREYLDQCLRHREQVAGYLEVQYEELLRDPRGGAAALARFIGNGEDERIPRAAALVRPPG
jgi:hypothetical protein